MQLSLPNVDFQLNGTLPNKDIVQLHNTCSEHTVHYKSYE